MSFRWMPFPGPARPSRRRSDRRSGRPASNRRRFQLDLLEDRTLLSSSIPLNSATWTPIGPAGVGGTSSFGGGNGGPAAGRISGIAADPTNANVIYVAATGGGVWKTTNGGVSWTPLTDNQSTLWMGSIAVAKSAPNTIYAGTGQADNSGDSYYGRGVLKSTDGGATWTLLGNSVFNRKAIMKVAISPVNPQTVYVAVATPDVNGVPGNNGIWKSVDGGATWTNTTTSITTTADFTDVVMDPTNALTLYAAVGNSGGAAANGVYKTTDGGVTWAPAGNFPTGTANGRISLAIGTSDPKTLVASVSDPATSGLKYLLKTSDAGATWSNLTSAPSYLGTQGDYDNTVAIDPSNANNIFAAGVTNYGRSAPFNMVIESRDGGNTWFDATVDPAGGEPHTDEHASGFDAAGHYLVAGDGGIWRLENPIQTSLKWTDINGNLQTTQFVGAAIDPLNNNIVLGGSQDNGSEKFNDNKTWNQVWGGDGGYVAIDPTNDQTLYVTNPGVAIYRSDDGGSTFQSKTVGIGNDPVNFYAPLVMDPSNPSHLLYGTDHVYTTTNRGDSWTVLATPGTNGYTANSPVNTIAIAPSDPKTIYVATDTAQVFVSTDGGVNWTQRNIAAARDSISHITVDPNNPQVAYATRDAFNGGGGTGHVFKTVDGGANWTDISGNLPDLPAYSFAVDDRSGSNRLYVGNDNGVWMSSDGGTTWAPFKVGMPNVQVDNLILSTQLNVLLASTYGRGMWEIVATDSISVLPASLSATEGVALNNVMVASFNDSSKMGPPGSYTPTINWGDGTAATTGTVTDLGNGFYGVFASHTFAEEGSYKVAISVAGSSGTSGQGTTVLAVGDAPLSPVPTTVPATEGTKFSGVVGSFTDADPNAPLSDFSASIDWGDGKVTSGTVASAGGGQYTVSGSTTYNEEGNYPVNVTVKDVGGQSTVISSTASVGDAPLTPLPTTLSAVAGVGFANVVVASFADTDPAGTAADYTVSINWGDGSPPTTLANGASIVNRGGRFDVLASHTYPRYGTYSATVTVTDSGGATTAPVSTVTVADAALTAVGQNLQGTEGGTFNGVVATFSSANPFAQATDFAAPTITWGDGSAQDKGTIKALGGGKFSISGTHTFAEEGTFNVAVNVASLGTSTAQASSVMTVQDAPIQVSASPQTAVAGSAVSGTIATFNDTYPLAPLGDFTATIDWGDGTTSQGTITQPGGVGTTFLVADANGGHQYARAQSYPITVTVNDVGGATGTDTANAAITDAPFTLATMPLAALTEGGNYNGAVATFNTPNTLALAGDYIAQIDWGDGVVTGGLVTALGNGAFNVSSASPHGYSEEGSYPVNVTVTSLGGTSHTAATNVTVNDAPIFGVPAAPIAAVAGTTFSGAVGSFQEFAGAPLSDFKATINWGDGTTSAGTVSNGPNGTFLVSGTHLIRNPGSPNVTVTVTDVGSPTKPGQFTVGMNVADVPIAAKSTPIAAVQGGTFNGQVATFTQANPFALAGQFAAAINWGDGTVSSGTVIGSGGSFAVTGTHVYKSPSAGLPVTVTVAHVVNGKWTAYATASGTAHVLRPVTGGLSAASDTGPSNADGVTSVKTPVFTGKAEPGSTVRVFVAPTSNPSAATQAGSAVADALGNWSVQVGPLGDGSYVMTASMFDPTTGLSTPSTRLTTGGAGSPLVIATTGPTVAGVALNPATSQLVVVFHVGPGMMNYYGLANAASYSLAVPVGLSGLQAIPATALNVAFGPNNTLVVVLTYGGFRFTPGSYVVTLHAAGLTDLAGNMLVEKKLVTFPQASNFPNPDYVAQIDVNSFGLASAPHQYVSLAEQIAAYNYSNYVQGRTTIRAASVPQGPLFGR